MHSAADVVAPGTFLPGLTTPHLLSPEHQQYLLQRGVPVEWAHAAGFRSMYRSEVAKVLGYKRNNVGFGGLAIPFGDNYWVLRIEPGFEFDGRKFLYPSGSPSRPYLPPLDPSVWQDTAVPLVFVEGPVKAAALACAGIPAIGLAGATGGGHHAQRRHQEGITELHPLLQKRVAWSGRQVATMLDSDAWTNPSVRKGEEILGTALVNAGAQPYVARVPMVEGYPKLGADDFLLQVGADAVWNHLEQAKPWSAPRKRANWPVWSLKRRIELEGFLSKRLPRGTRVQAHVLYEDYVAWCAQAEVPQMSETLFSRKLPEVAKVKKTASRGSYFWQRVG